MFHPNVYRQEAATFLSPSQSVWLCKDSPQRKPSAPWWTGTAIETVRAVKVCSSASLLCFPLTWVCPLLQRWQHLPRHHPGPVVALPQRLHNPDLHTEPADRPQLLLARQPRGRLAVRAEPRRVQQESAALRAAIRRVSRLGDSSVCAAGEEAGCCCVMRRAASEALHDIYRVGGCWGRLLGGAKAWRESVPTVCVLNALGS